MLDQVRPQSRYFICTGVGFTTSYVYCARTLSMTADLDDAITLPLTDALRVSTRLRVQGLPTTVVHEEEARRARRWRRAVVWTIVFLIFSAAVAQVVASILAGEPSGLE